jgi:hypothetical protein
MKNFKNLYKNIRALLIIQFISEKKQLINKKFKRPNLNFKLNMKNLEKNCQLKENNLLMKILKTQSIELQLK